MKEFNMLFLFLLWMFSVVFFVSYISFGCVSIMLISTTVSTSKLNNMDDYSFFHVICVKCHLWLRFDSLFSHSLFRSVFLYRTNSVVPIWPDISDCDTLHWKSLVIYSEWWNFHCDNLWAAKNGWKCFCAEWKDNNNNLISSSWWCACK